MDQLTTTGSAEEPTRKGSVFAAVLDTRLSGILLLLAILTAWDLSARLKIIELVAWPPFFDIAARWVQLVLQGSMLMELVPSIRRILIGYSLAVSTAVPLGLLIGYSRRVFNLFEPILEALRPISVIALIPVIILFLGLDDEMKIFIIVYACFFPILLNTISGVRDMDNVLIDTTRTFGLTQWQTISRVMVPAAAPQIFTGMRISVGISLIAMVASEMLTGGNGIGAFILESQRTFRIRDMYAGIITLGIVGYLVNRSFVALERWMLRWHQGYGNTDLS